MSRNISARSYSCLIMLLLSVSLPLTAYGDHLLECEGTGIVVFHDHNPADAREACKSVKETTEYMAARGFDTDITLTVSIVDERVRLHDVEVTGKYDATTFHITVPSYEQCCEMAAEHPFFGLEMTRALWRSFVAHEMAHAVAQANFRMDEPPMISHEYIAYVVQIATLPPPLRERLLSHFKNKAFARDREISLTLLALNAEVFAVRAYRHFQKLTDRKAFLRRMLNGDFKPFDRY